ncbi:MAG: D-alanyl-D-alanine carboxypeptidase family protein, partial [Oscillospiraceae bacterium]|nr:D-alanyl-D-alanine carboxypeptidase family protein [Oscillospiraceae bacterium]
MISRFSVRNDTDKIEKEKENKTSSISETVSISESIADESNSDESVTDTEEVVETETETTAEVKEPKPDPADADNTWAMFLVNSQNPVPDKYCDGIERELVYESWREYYMDARMAEYMKQMLKAAAEDGHQLVIMSAYRTIDYQQRNFDNSVQDRITNLGMTEEEAYED